MSKTNPIIINTWADGVAESPYVGLGMVKLADIEAYPGGVKAKNIMVSLFHTAFSSTFTADASTDICTAASGTVPPTGTAVVLTTTGTLPAGLTTATTYFIIKLSGSTFKLATTIANALVPTPIDITDAGSGTHTVTTRNPGTIKHFVKDSRAGTLFAQDSNARVWYLPNGGTQFFLLNGNTLTSGSGNGLAVFLNSASSATYLFAFRNAEVDVVNVFATANLQAPSWSNAWQALNTGSGAGNSHQAILGQDNIIYFCDARFIGSILEKAGQSFDPSNSATFTFNNQALDTPQNEILNWLEELGKNLLAAGDIYNFIYPWDRVSSSYELPLAVPENSIKKIKNMGGIVYILAGTKGNIYSTQGTYVTHFKKIPEYLTNQAGSIANPLMAWGGIGARNGALLFGVSGQTSGNSGVYMVFPDGRLVMDQMPSTGSALVTAIFAEDDYYKIGYSGGADYSDTSGNRYSSYETKVQSQFYEVGTKTEPGSLATLEVQIGTPSSGGSCRIHYRRDRVSAFTQVAEFTTDGSTTSFETDLGLTDIENLQILVELAGTIEIREVRILP